MADRDFTPVLFSLEKKVVVLSAHITFGAGGVPTLDTSNSKGFCNVAQFTTSFTATAASTASFTAVSNFTDLYNGMVISGTNIPANSKISALNAGAGTFTSSNASTGAVSAVTATGGYILQLGTIAAQKVDTYVKVLGLRVLPDCSPLQGAAAVAASAPAAPNWFLLQNNISKAIPAATATTAASITLMCGSGVGTLFVNSQPASGEGVYIEMLLGNSTAL